MRGVGGFLCCWNRLLRRAHVSLVARTHTHELTALRQQRAEPVTVQFVRGRVQVGQPVQGQVRATIVISIAVVFILVANIHRTATIVLTASISQILIPSPLRATEITTGRIRDRVEVIVRATIVVVSVW